MFFSRLSCWLLDRDRQASAASLRYGRNDSELGVLGFAFMSSGLHRDCTDLAICVMVYVALFCHWAGASFLADDRRDLSAEDPRARDGQWQL